MVRQSQRLSVNDLTRELIKLCSDLVLCFACAGQIHLHTWLIERLNSVSAVDNPLSELLSALATATNTLSTAIFAVLIGRAVFRTLRRPRRTMTTKWTDFFFRSLDPERALDARSILQRGFLDLTATGALFLLLVVATKALRVAEVANNDSPVHYAVLAALEHVIFFSGAFLVLFADIYLLVTIVWDLWRSLRKTLMGDSVYRMDTSQPASR
jgi:hypothetical protein